MYVRLMLMYCTCIVFSMLHTCSNVSISRARFFATAASLTTTPTVVSTMKLGDSSSQIVQVSSVNKPNTAFVDINVNKLLPKTTTPPQSEASTSSTRPRTTTVQQTTVHTQPVVSTITNPAMLPSPTGQPQPLLGNNTAQLVSANPALTGVASPLTVGNQLKAIGTVPQVSQQ